MITIDGHNLTIDEIVKIAFGFEEIALSKKAINQIGRSNNQLVKIINSKKPVYGINTGFGIFADKRIGSTESAKLSRNLIISHAVGCGRPLSSEIVRAAMVIRANTLCKGFSGVRREIVEVLVNALNAQVDPIIPSQGSLGSSGDLCQLSHLALVLTKDQNDLDAESGSAKYRGNTFSGKKAMQDALIERPVLGPKEGLAFNNGATFTAATAVIVIDKLEYLANLADQIAALSLEVLRGCPQAFDSRIHHARGMTGQKITAMNIRKLVQGSELIGSSNRVQDAYSLRCIPQIHGAVRDTLSYCKEVISKEINAATDNPLIFGEDVLSGGNFHGEPIGFIMDFLKIAMCELGSISERRVFRMTSGELNDHLPPMLVDDFESAGLNSGLMMPQYTSASLVLENITLATPDSIHSLPTSGSQEDHNANAASASRHAMDIITNLEIILAIELFTAARGIDLRLAQKPSLKLGNGTKKLYSSVRQITPGFHGDALWGIEINKVTCAIREKIF